MRTMYKYNLKITDDQLLMIPYVAFPARAVGVQDGRLFLWIEVDTELQVKPVVVKVIGTGNPMTDMENYTHIGTVIMPQSMLLVWHVFVDLDEIFT